MSSSAPPPSESAPPIKPGDVHAAPPVTPDATHGVIPYKNPRALMGYYMAIFGLLVPGLGVAAMILGLMGWRDYDRNPVIKGVAHAWVAIILGSLETLVLAGVLGSLLVMFLAPKSAYP